MKYATFDEFEAAKLEIIYGVDYSEDTQFPNQYGMASKQYTTKDGSFFQVTDPNTLVTEFWSTKHPDSRYYNGMTKAERIVRLEAENERLSAELAQAQERNKLLRRKIRRIAGLVKPERV
jgi:hypothetical protein